MTGTPSRAHLLRCFTSRETTADNMDWGHALFLRRDRVFLWQKWRQKYAGVPIGRRDILRCARRHYSTAVDVTPFGPEVDDVISGFHNFKVMFNHDDCITLIN